MKRSELHRVADELKVWAALNLERAYPNVEWMWEGEMGIWLEMHRQELVESGYHAPTGAGSQSELVNPPSKHLFRGRPLIGLEDKK